MPLLHVNVDKLTSGRNYKILIDFINMHTAHNGRLIVFRRRNPFEEIAAIKPIATNLQYVQKNDLMN